MKKKRKCMALAAALTMSLALSATALAAVPSDIGGHWAQATIIQWASKGYISSYPDGTFKPDNSITRAEFVVLVNKSMGYTKTGNTYFSDVSTSHWAYNEIQKGVAAGYIRGDGNGTFRPDDPVSRQEAAVMISQICGLGQDFSAAAKYTDYRYMPSWAAGYIGAVSDAKIMSGYPDGDFKADRYISRAETVISLDKAVSYNASATDDREELKNYTLKDTTLKDKIIKGDLVISSSLSKKDVSLENVKVEGKLIVEGGKTITAKNCEINTLEMSYSDATFQTSGKTTVKKTTFEKYGKLIGSGYSQVVIENDFNDYVTLDAEIKEVELDEETNVKLLSDCVIDSFTATKNADNATINFNSAKVKNMYLYDAVRITGKGDIKDMTVYASGVRSSIKPDDLSTKNGASKPTYTTNSSGDITWGGSSRYDDLTASRDKTYSGGKYDDVKVTADGGVKLKDMTIYGNLYITKSVKEGEVHLDDVTVKGNVYIEGGGENTITFDDCVINGNIYARKEYGSKPVSLYFDSYTDSHFDGKLVISENGAIVKGDSGVTIDNVEVRTGNKVEINTNVKNLYVYTKTSDLTIDSGREVTKLTVANAAKDSEITNYGTVKEIYTNVDVKVAGSGTVEKNSGNGTVNGISVTGVSLDKTELSLKKGETYTLNATVTPSTATNKGVTWSSSKESVATVENGKVTAVGAGEATITVTTEDGSHTASCEVTVNPATVAVTGVTLDKTELSLKVGETYTLNATVSPSDATDKSVTWSSDHSEIAEVSDTGVVTAKSEGVATITVTTKDGSHTASCEVTVNPATVAVTGVTLDKTTANMTVGGGTLTLTATVSPSDATNKGVTWSSDHSEIAEVSDTGVVTAKSEGAATITVTTKDGSHTASCTVTVSQSLENAKAELTNLLSQYANTSLQSGTNATSLTIVESEDASDTTYAGLSSGAKYVLKSNETEFNAAINSANTVLTGNSDLAAIKNAITAFNNAITLYVKTKA